MRLEDVLVFAGLALVLTFLAIALAYRREIAQRLADRASQLRPHQILAALVGLAVARLWTLLDFQTYRFGYFGLVLAAGLAGVAIEFAVSWVREFRFLMALRDDDLPGRFDKPIWAALLIALPPLGLFLFRSHRLAHWPEPQPKPRPGMSPAAGELA
jgi:hypothetical protein